MTVLHFLLCPGLSSVRAQHWTSTEGDGAEGKSAVCLRTAGPQEVGETATVQGGAASQPECGAQVLYVSSPSTAPLPEASFLEKPSGLFLYLLNNQKYGCRAGVTIPWGSCPRQEVAPLERQECLRNPKRPLA